MNLQTRSRFTAAQPRPTAGWVACPLALLQAVPVDRLDEVKAIYQTAFREAEAVLRPSITERLHRCNWN